MREPSRYASASRLTRFGLENVPPIPREVSAAVQRYQNYRAAAFEEVAFLDQAHYSMVKTTTFNGVPLPSIWLWDSETDSLECIKRFGYEDFRDFDDRERALIEPLRTLRMIHHSAWLAERWGDPAFPIAFPNFDSPSYWAQQATQLQEQLEAMAGPALVA